MKLILDNVEKNYKSYFIHTSPTLQRKKDDLEIGIDTLARVQKRSPVSRF